MTEKNTNNMLLNIDCVLYTLIETRRKLMILILIYNRDKTCTRHESLYCFFRLTRISKLNKVIN